MGLKETLALTPALSPRRGGSTHSSRNFHALWCGVASWGLTSAATRAVQATSFNDSVLQAVLLSAILVCFGVAAANKAGFTGSHFTPGRRSRFRPPEPPDKLKT